MSRRVVVTGLGVVSPLGNNTQTTWNALLNGENAVREITYFDTTNFRVKIAAELQNFNAEDYVDYKEIRRTDFHQHYIIAAANEVIADSNFVVTEETANRSSTFIASSTGGLKRYQQYIELIYDTDDPRKMTPFAIPMLIVNAGNNLIAMAVGAKGPSAVQVSACATGADNIGHAFDLIRAGRIDRALAGCSDYPITNLGVAVFDRMRAYSRTNDPDLAMQPFDRDRTGFVFGEGCGVVAIETLESAQARGAHIYAELIGYGSTTDAFHRTAPIPDGSGAAEAMRLALIDAKVNPEDIDYINAHGTGTLLNDPMETKALKTTFGDHAYNIPISATKSMMGHAMGATSAMEAAFTVLSLQHQVAPPTIHLYNPDPECDLDYIPHTAREFPIEIAMTNSFGFGGHNASLIFKRFND
ncbi:MAG: beta-ketoacyl-ACP synthase II [Chloroflexota bacterium]